MDKPTLATFLLVAVTLLLVVVTAVYVRLTYHISRTAARQLEHAIRASLPDWSLATGDGSRMPTVSSVEFRNIGGSPADKIRLSTEPELPSGLSIQRGEAILPIREQQTLRVSFEVQGEPPLPWEGSLVIVCGARQGRRVTYERRLRIAREPHGKKLLMLEILDGVHWRYDGA